MIKLWFLTLLTVAALVQIATARDIGETLNVNIREQLNLYEKFQKEADSAKYADQLKKLIDITQSALKVEDPDEKNKIIVSAPTHFTEEFNKFIGAKLEESQVNNDINNAIQFYKSLLTSGGDHEAEIKQTISTLESTLIEKDLKQKEEKFFNLNKGFSADFEKFLKESALPSINRQLKTTSEFFEKLLHDNDNKFANEIKALKKKADDALASNISTDDKTKVLEEINYTNNKELDEFLQKKNIEYLS